MEAEELMQSSGAKSLIKGSGQEEMMSLLANRRGHVCKNFGKSSRPECLEASRTRKLYQD